MVRYLDEYLFNGLRILLVLYRKFDVLSIPSKMFCFVKSGEREGYCTEPLPSTHHFGKTSSMICPYITVVVWKGCIFLVIHHTQYDGLLNLKLNAILNVFPVTPITKWKRST